VDLDAQHRPLVSGSDFEEAEIGFRQNIADLPKAGALRSGQSGSARLATSAPRSNRYPKPAAAGRHLSVRGGSRSRARRKAAPLAGARPHRARRRSGPRCPLELGGTVTGHRRNLGDSAVSVPCCLPAPPKPFICRALSTAPHARGPRPSSSGPGRRPFTAETWVRFP
jgi:hypothetical protein